MPSPKKPLSAPKKAAPTQAKNAIKKAAPKKAKKHTFPEVNPKQSFPGMEESIQHYWKKNQIFETSVKNRSPKKTYTFYDGPPFATGLPHYGHILQSTIKDIVPRFRTMQGYHVPRRWGWDCHGLPIEYLIEKELGLKGAADIEKLGVAKFNAACRASVQRYATEWKTFIHRLGRFVDMENDYKTMDTPFMESVWAVFKSLHDKGLIYEGYKSMHVSPALSTPLSNFEVGLNYKDITDLSAYVQFPVVGKEHTYFLAWTTTPWTLPGNVLLAVGADISYATVAHEGAHYILAASLVEKHFGEDAAIIQKTLGASLLGTRYQPPFTTFQKLLAPHTSAFTVQTADFVTTEDGTGIVHIAPGFGEDDFLLGKSCGLPVPQHVGIDGRFTADLAPLGWEGISVKPADDPAKTDRDRVIPYLKEHGFLFKTENYRHSYPHCWRTDVPLINYATRSWFVAVEKIKKTLLATNQKVTWTPDHVKAGRFGKWLENARDWSISRSRYWGCPLPIWKNDITGDIRCIGSVAELQKLTGKKVTDLHKEFVDDLTFVDPATKPIQVTLLRHGETDWNAQSKWQGHTDIPLNSLGKKQAAAAAKKLAKHTFDVVLSSDLSRAKETAQIVAPNARIITEPLLRERHFGDFEGLTTQEIAAQHPAIHTSNDVRMATPPNGESLADLDARTKKVIALLHKKYAGKRVLIVCHSGTLKSLRAQMGGSQDLMEELPNCATFSATITPTYRRITEVLDCWFESGSMPYASRHFPFEKGDSPATAPKHFPADFIAEAQDQTRGWFYTLHVLAGALYGTPAFKNCVCSGLVLAEDGQKMSKSKKNYPDPMDIIHEFGADALRLYLVSSPIVQGEELRFSRRGVEDTLRSVLLPLWNSYYFFTTYARADGITLSPLPKHPKNRLDRYLLSEVNLLIQEVTEKLESSRLNEAARPLAAFFENLTNWYIRRSRRRFWKSESDSDKAEAYAVLHHALTTSSRLLAPFCPFIADEIYRGLTGEESVHLADFPTVDKKRIDSTLHSEVAITQLIIRLGLSVRAEQKVKVRTPLASATVALPHDIDSSILTAELDTIREELNIKELVFALNPSLIAEQVITVNARALGPRLGAKVQDIIRAAKAGEYAVKADGIHVLNEVLTGAEVTIGYASKAGQAIASDAGCVVALDCTLTPELIAEGAARDLVRAIQDMRKEANLAVSDRIHLSIQGADDILATYADYIAAETLATTFGPIKTPLLTKEIDGITIAIAKA